MADGVPTTPTHVSGSRSATLIPAVELAHTLTPRTAPNGVRYATAGETKLSREELERVLHAVPAALGVALADRVFYFVPLALPEGRRSDPDAHSGQTLISTVYDSELSDEAICHRNVSVPAANGVPAHEGVFLSANLLRDQFSLAFELFINVGHLFAGAVGVPEEFEDLAWSQARSNVRGESSQDAWEFRHQALGIAPNAKASAYERGKAEAKDERAKSDFLLAAFADALAIYQLSLAVDFDYAELREREYPLLAPAALADRLRLMAKMFPPNAGYEFSIRYRRR